MKINWGVVGTVAGIAFQTVMMTAAILSSANATQDAFQNEMTTVKTQIGFIQRDVDRLTDKVFP